MKSLRNRGERSPPFANGTDPNAHLTQEPAAIVVQESVHIRGTAGGINAAELLADVEVVERLVIEQMVAGIEERGEYRPIDRARLIDQVAHRMDAKVVPGKGLPWSSPLRGKGPVRINKRKNRMPHLIDVGIPARLTGSTGHGLRRNMLVD